ncbi:MAG: hypothetical protein ACI8VI_001936 [Granulosicoccus sp.]|jgi:hypothetical protein
MYYNDIALPMPLESGHFATCAGVLVKWNKEWEKLETSSSERDKKVYKAGVYIDM